MNCYCSKIGVIFAVIAVLVSGGVCAQGSGDTIDFTPRNPNYYYNDWWMLDQDGDTVRNWFYHALGVYQFRYNYTDRPLRSVGLAAVMESFELRAGNPYASYDTTLSDEYLLLCDAYPDSFVTRAQIQWNLADSHRYVRQLLLENEPGMCCWSHVGEYTGRLYTYYFDEPVVVYDSFYLGCTKNWYWNWLYPDDRMSAPPVCYGRGIVGLYGPPINLCDKNSECPSFTQRYRVEVLLDPLFYGPDSIWVSYQERPLYSLIFPIVEHPECGRVDMLRATVQNDGRVQLTWRGDSPHASWEVAYGLAGTSLDSCTVVQSDTTEVMLNINQGQRYVAYVRAFCRHIEAEYYSEWSDSVVLFIPNRYSVTAESSDLERGSVEGGGVYEEGETAELRARAWRHYRFQQWDDGVTENPRRFVVTQDSSFTAFFSDPEGIASADSLGGLVQLLPNPATERVRVQSGCGLRVVEVFDGHGRMVLTQTAEGNEAEIDISSWAPGSYVVRVYTGLGVASRRLVVE